MVKIAPSIASNGFVTALPNPENILNVKNMQSKIDRKIMIECVIFNSIFNKRMLHLL